MNTEKNMSFKIIGDTGFSFPNCLYLKLSFVKIVVLALILSIVLPAQQSFAKSTTWNTNSGGAWTTAGNWTNGLPAGGDDVTINSDQSAAITAIPDISLNSLTISGNCNFQSNASSGNYRTLTVTGNMIVALDKTFTVGLTNAGRLNFTLANTATGNIAGTVYMNSYNGSGYDRSFTNNGNLTITSTGMITGQNSADFTLSSGATLQIGSPAGISTTGATGNIQIPGTRTYNAGANYIYIGTTNQVTGNALTTANNLTINTASPSVTVTSATPFTANNLTVTQGNLILQATSANYTVSNDLTIAANGALTHSVNWDSTSKLLSVGGNIAIDGIFKYTTRSHVQMISTGTKTVRTGSNVASSFSILTLLNGTFNASGTLKVDDNFWAMFNTTGSFHTNGQTVTGSAGVLNSGGTVYIDGGTLNITAGITVGAGTNGNVVFSSGTLNADAISVGNGTSTGTFTQSGGTCNVSGSITIYPSCTFACTNSPTINIGGNWTKNGTYTKATETVNFNGNADQMIGGSSGTSFYNLAFSGSGVKTVPAGTSVSGNLSISGATASLNNGIIVAVNSLRLGGISQPAGTWGSSISAATYKINTYFASTTGMLNVATGIALPTAVFSGLTASQIVCPGTSTLSLGGVVSAGSVFPANGETVGVTINGITQYTAIAGGAGGFSLQFNTSGLPASGTPYPITYSYAGGIYLSAAMDNSSTSLVVNVPVAIVTDRQDISCHGGTDGSIIISASGGNGPYSFSVDNGDTWVSSDNNPYLYGGLKANTPYQIRVKDGNGCESTIIP